MFLNCYENVQGLLKHDKGKSFKIKSELKARVILRIQNFKISDYGIPNEKTFICEFKNIKVIDLDNFFN